MLTASDQDRIRAWAADRPAPRPLKLVVTDDPRSGELERFAEALAGLAPALEIRRERVENGGRPALAVEERIRYHALPVGPELAPFLDALAGESMAEPAPDLARRLEALNLPAPLRLFISSDCPFCPVAVRGLLSLVRACRHISVAVIDGRLFPEWADVEQVASVPTVLLDPGFRWTGVPNMEEIVTVAAERDPLQLGADTLRGLMEAGKAEEVAAMMVRRGRFFPALIDLLTHEKWPVRLGAMVAVEYLAAEAPDLAARGAEPLWRAYADAPDDVRGDLLHVLGDIAPAAMADAIESAGRAETHREIREAAQEAEEKIRSR